MAEVMNLNGKLYTGYISGSQSHAVPLDLAKEIVNKITIPECSFSILHQNQGIRHAYGYIYSNKMYGFITIEQYSGFHVSYAINEGVYTLIND